MLIELKVQIKNSEGFHLRPITKLAEIARNFDGDILLHYNGNMASAKNVMEMMILAVPCGGEMFIQIRGEKAKSLVDSILDIFAPHIREEW